MAKKPEAAPADKPGTVKARVIATCELGKINDVIEVGAEQVVALAGVIDAHPDAVAYAESLKA